MRTEIERSFRVCFLACGGIAVCTDESDNLEDELLLAVFTDHREMDPFWKGVRESIKEQEGAVNTGKE